jgi:hypothetical protein
VSEWDRVSVGVDRLTDTELRFLLTVYEKFVDDDSLPAQVREWYRHLCTSIHSVLITRFFVWSGLVEASTVPRDWDTAVRTLPPEPRPEEP